MKPSTKVARILVKAVDDLMRAGLTPLQVREVLKRASDINLDRMELYAEAALIRPPCPHPCQGRRSRGAS